MVFPWPIDSATFLQKVPRPPFATTIRSWAQSGICVVEARGALGMPIDQLGSMGDAFPALHGWASWWVRILLMFPENLLSPSLATHWSFSSWFSTLDRARGKWEGSNTAKEAGCSLTSSIFPPAGEIMGQEKSLLSLIQTPCGEGWSK